MAPTDQHEIIKLIDSLKQQNSSGHDNITSSLIKDIKHEIAMPLTILFNKSIHSGRVPKLAKVIPIYKAKDKELLNNYRPISLLPTKLFTKCYIIFWFLNQYFIIANTVLTQTLNYSCSKRICRRHNNIF